ncbi:MAG: hypothetical protein JSR45_08455 [Proteobacteria bacterium]|nr:hypothetical protein [Pseudomonadota bacterium]
MNLHDFGGFSARNLIVDVRFRSQAQFKHFWGAWTTSGPPSVPAQDPNERFLLIGSGTTLEHEFRHYHDFLLSYSSLQTYWFRLQIFMSGLPLVLQVLEDPDVDVVPFPVVAWAELSPKERQAYLEDALGKAHSSRPWSPPYIRGSGPSSKGTFVTGREPGYEQQVLHLLSKQVFIRDNTRRGTVSAGAFALTPRFLFELSALLAQAFAVNQTYGLAEFVEFLAYLSRDKSMYAAFFTRMLVLFQERSATPPEHYPLAINWTKVDWRALSVMATWCMLGCHQDGEIAYPERRWARVYRAAIQDFEAVFPRYLNEPDLLRHLDSLFKVTPFDEALRATSDHLGVFLAEGTRAIRDNPNTAEPHEAALAVFEGLLKDRRILVERFIAEPAAFCELPRHMQSQQDWPLCPVHLKLWESGAYALKEDLNRLHADARFNLERNARDEACAGDVLYPQLFSGGTAVPLDQLLLLNRLVHGFEIFLDPHQLNPSQEMDAREVFMTRYGKSLLRVH